MIAKKRQGQPDRPQFKTSRDRIAATLRGRDDTRRIRVVARQRVVQSTDLPRPYICGLGLLDELSPDSYGLAIHFEFLTAAEVHTLAVDLAHVSQLVNDEGWTCSIINGTFLVTEKLSSRKSLIMVVPTQDEKAAVALVNAFIQRIHSTPVRNRMQKWFKGYESGTHAWLMYGEEEGLNKRKPVVAWTIFGEIKKDGPTVAELLAAALSDPRAPRTEDDLFAEDEDGDEYDEDPADAADTDPE